MTAPQSVSPVTTEALPNILMRCRTVLGNMALENEAGLASIFDRWPISHEPLRADAKNLVPLIDEALRNHHEAFMAARPPDAAARAPAPAALSDQIEDIICGGNCMHPEVCDGTETTWCGQRTEELLGLIAPAQRPLQPAETQKIAADAIRTFCRSLGAAAVQNSHGVERIYHAGISLDALAAAVALALSSTEGNTP
jgi:hypothetical protein